MSEIERVEIIKKSMCYGNTCWNTWGEKTRIEYAREIAQQYKQLTDEYWKQYTWQAMAYYQRMLKYIIEALK